MSSIQVLSSTTPLDDLVEHYNAIAARLDHRIGLSIIKDSISQLEQLRLAVVKGLSDKTILDRPAGLAQDFFSEADMTEQVGYLLQDIDHLMTEYADYGRQLTFADEGIADPCLADLN